MNILNQFLQCKVSLGDELIDLNSRLNNLNTTYEGLKKGSFTIVRAKDPIDFSLEFFLALDKGLIPIPVANDIPEIQLNRLIEKYQGEGSGFEDAYACLTSGSTGEPKLCVLSVKNALLNARAHASSLEISENQTVVQTLPLYHSFGIVCYLFGAIEIGFHLNLNKAFLGLKSLNRKNVDKGVIHLSPAQVQFITKEAGESTNQFEVVSIGGGVASKSSLEVLAQKFPKAKLYATYGLTEAGPRVTSGLWQKEKYKTGDIGKALSGIQLKVLNSNGELVLKGEGLLAIKTPFLKLNDRDDLVDDFYITRDIVSLQNGSVCFNSREGDLINRGGISVYPRLIEEIVNSHKEIEDCIVFKEQSDDYEEVPVLVVETNLSVDEVKSLIKYDLDIHQKPVKIFCFKEFPRMSLNKIDRNKLKKWMQYE